MDLLEWLEASRRREREQARFYRALAREAGIRSLDHEVDRLNELHADEQHHLSRLTARLLDLGGDPGELPAEGPAVEFSDWERAAREREAEEVAWYSAAVDREMDADTRAVVEEILASEEKHHAHLGGKWMSA